MQGGGVGRECAARTLSPRAEWGRVEKQQQRQIRAEAVVVGTQERGKHEVLGEEKKAHRTVGRLLGNSGPHRPR